MTSEAMRQTSGELDTATGQESKVSTGEETTQHSALHDYMNSAVEQTGKILKAMGEKVRVLAESARDEPGPRRRARQVAERVARRLESSGQYLQTSGSDQVGDRLAGVVQRYPLRSVGACLALGWILGSATRRRGI